MLANQNQAAELSIPVEQKLKELQAQYVGVTQLQSEVNTLTSDLDEVIGIVDLQSEFKWKVNNNTQILAHIITGLRYFLNPLILVRFIYNWPLFLIV